MEKEGPCHDAFGEEATSALLSALLLTGVFSPFAKAAEPEDFPVTEDPLMGNTTDSSRLPTYAESLADVYSQVDTTDADVIGSMFSDEAWDRFGADLDRILDFAPVEDAEVAPVLGRVETFLSSGAYSSCLQNGNLLMGAEIGLTRSKEEKVKILGADANAGAWVFVVDKDAMCFFVKDSEGMGIPNALVTLSCLDESGARVTKSVPATAGRTPGIAAFDEIPSISSAFWISRPRATAPCPCWTRRWSGARHTPMCWRNPGKTICISAASIFPARTWSTRRPSWS